MPRKPEPSFQLKAIIWDIAATVGTANLQSIVRQLDYELQEHRKEGAFFEDIPEQRTVKRIIEKDINDLSPDIVVSKLPKHVWKLRKDYHAIERLAQKSEVNRFRQIPGLSQEAETTIHLEGEPIISQKEREQVDNLTAKAKEKHLGEIHALIEEWKDAIRTPMIDEVFCNTLSPANRTVVCNTLSPTHHIEADPFFEYLKEHLPFRVIWGPYTSWSRKIAGYLDGCQQMIERIGREDLVCNWENKDWNWMLTTPETYIRSILKRISEKMLGNMTVGCQLNHQLYSYIGVGEDGETGWVDNIPDNADPDEYTEVFELLLNDESIGVSDDVAGAQEVLKLVIDHYLNLEETANLTFLFNELRAWERDIHASLHEILLQREYSLYKCKICQR